MVVAKVMKPVSRITVCLLLAICMALMGLPVLPRAHADAVTAFTVDGYTATVLTEPDGETHGTCEVTLIDVDAIDADGVCDMPEVLSNDGKSYDVTVMAASWNSGVSDSARALLKKVILPTGLVEIGSSAFSYCTLLTNIDFSVSSVLETIGSRAFFRCTSLSRVDIPESVKNIGADVGYFDYGSFRLCTSLKSISFENGSKVESAPYAFSGCSSLESVDMGACSSLIFDSAHPIFDGCSAVNNVVLPDSSDASLSVFPDTVSIRSVSIPDNATKFKIDSDGSIYTTDGSELLWLTSSAASSVVLPSGCISVGAYAFAGHTSVASVEFSTGSSEGFIGQGAFKGCASLKSVDFATDTLQYIDSYAFSGCTALESIEVPGLLRQSAYSNYYSSDEGTRYTSGYIVSSESPCNPVKSFGVGNFAFQNCTSLTTVRFGAGSKLGCYALVNKAGNTTSSSGVSESNAFAGCTALKSIAFDGKQPYWMNEDASVGSKEQGSGFYVYAQYIEYFSIDRPQFYYSVDYYATEQAAESDDAMKSGRIGTVEYARGTSTAAIASGDATALAGSLYNDIMQKSNNLYSDGEVLDPNQVAHAQGWTGDDWAWAFEGTCGDYADLYESCYVYLVHSTDLSHSHAEGAPLSSMREPIVSNLSDSFDVFRWYGENKWGETYSNYGMGRDSYDYQDCFDSSCYDQTGPVSSSRKRFAGSCYYTWGSHGLIEDFNVISADGEKLTEGVDYKLSYQMTSGVLSEDAKSVELTYLDIGKTFSGIQPILVTVTALAEGRCAEGTTFNQWVLAQSHSATASVKDSTGGTSAWNTVTASEEDCRLIYKNNPQYNSRFKVVVRRTDPASSLIGAGYAGLLEAEVRTNSSDTASLGFSLKVDDVNKNYERQAEESLSETANFFYSYWEKNHDEYDVTSEDYPWRGALVVDPTDASSWYAAAVLAYSEKRCVFYAEDDGTLSADTLRNVKSLASATVVGSTSFVQKVAGELSASAPDLGVETVAADAGDACGLTIAAAEHLLANGSTASTVAVVNGADLLDTVAAQNLSGYELGLTLVSCCSADSKRIASFLRQHRDEVDQVRVYGRDTQLMSSASFDPVAFLQEGLWDESDGADGAFASACEVTDGDTICVSGTVYRIDGGIADMAASLAGADTSMRHGDVVSYGGRGYTVGAILSGYEGDWDFGASSFTYDGQAHEPVLTNTLPQGVGVSYSYTDLAGSECVPIDAGSYTVTATFSSGAESVTAPDPVSFSFTIVRADRAVSLAGRSVTYTGKAVALTTDPAGAKVTYYSDKACTKALASAPKNAGTYYARAVLAGDANHNEAVSGVATIAIAKATQRVTASKTTVTRAFAAAKKGACKGKLKAAKYVKSLTSVFGLSSKGAKTFKKASGNAKIRVSKTGKVTVKKGLKKGAYTVKVKVTAAATTNYSAATKTITLKVKVK